MNIYFNIVYTVLSLCMSFAFKQRDNDIITNNKINQKRLNTVIITESVLYAGSMTALYSSWYSKYPKSRFHFFNDNSEWMQMDKFGHATTSYYLGTMGYEALRWAGVDNRRAAWYGGTIGLLYLANLEIFDGFSSQWGFSSGDMAANVLGTGLFVGQQLGWNEQRFLLKWSYHHTIYPAYRPDLLGKSKAERWLKDYNGQTYWISANIASFMKKDDRIDTRFNIQNVKLFNLALGFGAEGMLGGRENPLTYNDKPLPAYKRIRKFYLSSDLDLSRLETKSSITNLGLNAVSFFKTPMPALEFNTNKKLRFHLLY